MTNQTPPHTRNTLTPLPARARTTPRTWPHLTCHGCDEPATLLYRVWNPAGHSRLYVGACCRDGLTASAAPLEDCGRDLAPPHGEVVCPVCRSNALDRDVLWMLGDDYCRNCQQRVRAVAMVMPERAGGER